MAEEEPKTGDNWRDEGGKFMPGHPGMGGRPRVSITEHIREMLLEVPPGEKKSNLDSIVQGIIRDAKRGDMHMCKLVWNYVDGLPKASLNVGGNRESLEELTNFLRSMAQGENNPLLPNQEIEPLPTQTEQL